MTPTTDGRALELQWYPCTLAVHAITQLVSASHTHVADAADVPGPLAKLGSPLYFFPSRPRRQDPRDSNASKHESRCTFFRCGHVFLCTWSCWR